MSSAPSEQKEPTGGANSQGRNNADWKSTDTERLGKVRRMQMIELIRKETEMYEAELRALNLSIWHEVGHRFCKWPLRKAPQFRMSNIQLGLFSCRKGDLLRKKLDLQSLVSISLKLRFICIFFPSVFPILKNICILDIFIGEIYIMS